MDKKIIECSKTLNYGDQRYRVNINGDWQVLMFGTFGPSDNGIPKYAWRPIPSNKVPDKVRSYGYDI